MRILVTGGAGYIGSHTCVELLKAGYEIVVIDNLVNSHEESLERVKQIAGRDFPFIKIDIRDRAALDEVFTAYSFDGVIHFAGLKAVGESVQHPLPYYDNNVGGSTTLLEVMAEHGVKTFVFSSSASVYGDPVVVPIGENSQIAPANPYGRTKYMVELMLQDLAVCDQDWRIAILRYFNPVGAHESGLIGEDPNGPPNNLMPFVAQVAIGSRPCLSVFGDDYPTPDGTGVRDYIHVVDLAYGHVQALRSIGKVTGVNTWNLGSGCGYSVLEMVRAFEAASGKSVSYRIAPRRDGDVAKCFADPKKAEQELEWKTQRGLEEMCADSWRWQTMNPNGYLKTK